MHDECNPSPGLIRAYVLVPTLTPICSKGNTSGGGKGNAKRGRRDDDDDDDGDDDGGSARSALQVRVRARVGTTG